MSAERPKAVELPLEPTERWRVFLALVGGTGTVGALVFIFAAYRAVLAEARTQTDGQISPVVSRVTNVEAAALHNEQRLYDTQLDVRELYKTMPREARSVRLEAPPAPLVVPAILDGGSK